MGVPLLLTWLRKRFSACFFPAEGEVSDSIRGAHNLYIDLNSLLYQSATIVSVTSTRFNSVDEVEDAVLRKLFDLLDHILGQLVNPSALVYIAVDGVSPMGKMSQQRLRRRRHSSRRPQSGGGGGGGSSFRTGNMDQFWDGNCISVGTRFMAKATEALHFYAVSRTERENNKRWQAALQVAAAAAAATNSSAKAAVNSASTASPSVSGGASPAPPATPPVPPFKPLSIVVDDVLRPGEGENKIAEAIRRFRAQDGYDANTSHVICSSDTDVTVSSLILHEPRIHVLRYEPPPSIGGKPTHLHGGGGGDSWTSTFFSIALFRMKLREILGLGTDPVRNSAATEEENSRRFERALHDVVFVMLLFGNDFLPTLGGSIQEGMLDALLSLLATDFVSRDRTVVDPKTNHILFTSARYLMDCLADLRSKGIMRGDGLLHVNAGGADQRWNYGDDEGFRARQRAKEKNMEKKCYCYWTMLQWALQYSAGVVDHWGCYYPFSDAPPLQMLRRYCGVLSYEALVKFAAARHAAKARQTTGAAGPMPVGDDDDDADVELDMKDLVTDESKVVGASVVHTAVDRGRPTDVMVQLLVLMPPRSVDLLPTVFRQRYKEVEEAVAAPVERLDLDSINRWCQEKRNMLSEEERTRFAAYHLFAMPESLAVATGAEPASSSATTASSGEAATTGAAEQQQQQQLMAAPPPTDAAIPVIRASEVAFMAYWPQKECVQELVTYLERCMATANGSTRSHATTSTATASAGSVPPSPSPAASSVLAKSSAFFSARRGAGGAAGSASAGGLGFGRKPGVSAAAAALLAASTPSNAPAASDNKAAPVTPSEDGEGTTTTAPPQSTPSSPPSATTPSSKPATPAPQSVAATASTASVTTTLAAVDGSFVFLVGPCSLLRDAHLIAAMGEICGNRFVVGSYRPWNETDAMLSRFPQTSRVRLHWNVVAAPDVVSTTYADRLLPGCDLPEDRPMRVVLEERQRAQEGRRADPWAMMQKTAGEKRARDDGASNTPQRSGNVSSDSDSEEEKPREVATGTSTTASPPPTAGAASTEVADSTPDMTDLEKRKEQVRRRLEALKAAQASGDKVV